VTFWLRGEGEEVSPPQPSRWSGGLEERRELPQRGPCRTWFVLRAAAGMPNKSHDDDRNRLSVSAMNTSRIAFMYAHYLEKL